MALLKPEDLEALEEALQGKSEGDPDFIPGSLKNHCGEMSSLGYFCTRETGHPGDHAAHGYHGTPMFERWPNEGDGGR